MMRQPNHHLFDPDNGAITLESLNHLARAVDSQLRIEVA